MSKYLLVLCFIYPEFSSCSSTTLLLLASCWHVETHCFYCAWLCLTVIACCFRCIKGMAQTSVCKEIMITCYWFTEVVCGVVWGSNVLCLCCDPKIKLGQSEFFLLFFQWIGSKVLCWYCTRLKICCEIAILEYATDIFSVNIEHHVIGGLDQLWKMIRPHWWIFTCVQARILWLFTCRDTVS